MSKVSDHTVVGGWWVNVFVVYIYIDMLWPIEVPIIPGAKTPAAPKGASSKEPAATVNK